MANIYEEFASYTMGNLKYYLSARGLSCQGNKQQLVSRCYVAWENGTELKTHEKDYMQHLQQEYKLRLKNAGIDDPRSIDNWSSDVKMWPNVDLGKIFAFLMGKTEHGMEYVGRYKTQKAYSYYISGFVDTVFATQTSEKVVVKSKVTPSQSVRNEPHDVWIVFDSQSSDIVCCWCSCIAGYAETCNHVIAVLYKVEYACTMGYTNPSCTSMPCSWNTTTKRDVVAGKITDMQIRQDNRSKVSGAENGPPKCDMMSEFKLSFDPRREDHRTIQADHIGGLYSKLHALKPDAVLFTGFPKLQTAASSMPDPIPVMAKEYVARGEGDKFLDALHKGFTKEQAVQIEVGTRGQAKSTQWSEQRKGRITASIAHDVSTKMDTLAKKRYAVTSTLAAKVLGFSPSIANIPAVKYGRDHEEMAIKEFHDTEGGRHIDFIVKKCGLFVRSDRPFLAGSPDGMVTCRCHGQASLEVKCPFTLRNQSVQVGWKETGFLQLASDGTISLKTTHKYYTQVQSQMAATGLKSSYFFVWSPHGCLIDRVEFDPKFWISLQQKLVQFYSSCIVPYLIGQKVIVMCPQCETVCLQEEEIMSQWENSIHCECCNLWYHWTCVGVKETPKTEKWVCNDCLQTAALM